MQPFTFLIENGSNDAKPYAPPKGELICPFTQKPCWKEGCGAWHGCNGKEKGPRMSFVQASRLRENP